MLTRRRLLAAAPIPFLRAQDRPRIITPSDPDYDAARKVASFNPTTDRHPRVIVRCSTPDDVVRAITSAREQDLEVAVRSGGHDVLGASTCDGMIIDLSPMQSIRVDPQTRIARVDPGVRSGALNAALQRHDLAAALGCHPGVGVAGLTLGGGLGWLLGKHGAACDHLLAADLITADGTKVHASATENPDLFWALRGGGGNFGIVTSLDLAVHPVGTVFGGVLVLRADVPRFLRFYRDFMQNAPDGLTVEITLIPPVIVAIACWTGSVADGERALQPLRTFSTSLADWIDRVPYARLTDRVREVGSFLPRTPPSTFSYWRGRSLRELNETAVAALLDHAPPGSSLGLGHFMHGRICRIDPDATPLIRTPGQFTCFINAAQPDGMEWVNRSYVALEPFSAKATYINYLSVDDPAAVQASYGAHYARLARIKARYDPSNFFHRNRNIRMLN